MFKRVMEYNKTTNFTKSNGRLLVSSGPRAAQERLKNLQDVQNLNALLTKQVEDLKKDLVSKNSSSNEDIDALILTEVNKAIQEVSDKYKDEINKLKIEIAEKNVIIKSKDEMIDMLKSGFINKEGNLYNENRPSIDTPLVDPVDNNNTLTSFITIKESKISNDNMASQVDKLKNILGRKV